MTDREWGLRRSKGVVRCVWRREPVTYSLWIADNRRFAFRADIEVQGEAVNEN